MQYRTFRSELAGGDVSYLIYLPPTYENSDKRYPTIYWLHGLNGRQSGAARLASRLDTAAKSGESPKVIVVGVNGLRASMYCNSRDGKQPVESVIVHDLIHHIDATYRTIPDREARGIAGMSMGGFGALRLGFKFPDVFGVVSSYAAALHTEKTLRERRTSIFDAVFGDMDYGRQQTPWTIVRQNADRIKGRSRIRLIIGTRDGLYGWNQDFRALLEGLEIPHEYIFVPGVAHNYRELEERTARQTAAFYRKAFADVGAEGR